MYFYLTSLMVRSNQEDAKVSCIEKSTIQKPVFITRGIFVCGCVSYHWVKIENEELAKGDGCVDQTNGWLIIFYPVIDFEPLHPSHWFPYPRSPPSVHNTAYTATARCWSAAPSRTASGRPSRGWARPACVPGGCARGRTTSPSGRSLLVRCRRKSPLK